MTPLHPSQAHVLRIRAAISGLALFVPAVIVDLGPLRETGIPLYYLSGAALLLLLVLVLVMPGRRYRAWGYRESADELFIRHGLWVRMRTVVPFGRVQHIDVAQGPIERRFGLATLILHTAGTRGAAVPLPGLEHPQAEAMRDRIRAQIRQELA